MHTPTKSILSSGWIMLVAIVVFFYPAVSQAAQVRKGDHVEVSADEVINDTLIATGQSVVIDGHVRGDAVAFARSVTVRGTVDGNLITAAERVEIDGTVRGSVMTAGQEVTVNGVLGSQLYAAGRALELGSGVELSGDALLAGAEIDVDGAIGRDVYAMGEDVEVGAAVQRDLVIGGADLGVSRTAFVGRDLQVKVEEADDLVVDEGASVLGATQIEVGAFEDDNHYDNIGFYIWKLVTIAAGLLFGFVFFTFAPDVFRAPRGKQHWLRMVGIGLAALLLIPIASIVSAATLVGLPLALVAMAAYLFALYLGKLVISAEIGRRILRFDGLERSQLVWSLLLGLVLVTILVELPYVGGVFGFVVAVLGLGSVSNYLLDMRKQRRTSEG